MRILLALAVCLYASSSHALNLGKMKDAGKTAASSDLGKAAGGAASQAALDKMNKKLQNVQNDKGPILFKTGGAAIDPKCDKTMQAIADIMAEFPGTHVEVNGHTDSSGNKKKNVKLSQDRANAVVDYLVKNKNVDAKRLSAKGYGPDKPIADTKTGEGRAKNRRVDFTVTSM